MSLTHQTLTPPSLAARRQNAHQSTGPRTAAGKRRVALNFLHRGVHGRSLRRSMRALGENPQEYQRLLAALLASHRPATPSEVMLVEDLAALRWQRRRYERARAGKLAHNLELLERERLRKAVEHYRTTQFETDAVRQSGLRWAPHSSGKFMEVVGLLHRIEEHIERADFSDKTRHLLQAVYGENPTGRGAAMLKLATDLAQPGPPLPWHEAARAALRIAVGEETHAVLLEHQSYEREQQVSSPILREVCLAPAQEEWRHLLRQEMAVDRQIERKIKLLMQMQRNRRAEERRTVGRVAKSKTKR